MLRHSLLVIAVLAFAAPALAADEDAKRKKPIEKLNPAEVFKRLDKNKDGKLDKNELPENFARFFDKIDTNKDGKIDQKEAEELVKRMDPAAKDPNGGGPTPAKFLENLDKNKDGKISKDEAKGPLQAGFDKLDGNKDGFLDKTELAKFADLLADRPKPRGDQPNQPKKDGEGKGKGEDFPFFDTLDKNADGRLTKEEVQNQPKIVQAFAAIDANKDGKIDAKEYETFLKAQK